MHNYIIEGQHRLSGKVSVGGSKNAALGVLAAAMVVDGPCIIDNVPEIGDINELLKLCQGLGATVEVLQKGKIRIDPSNIKTYEALDPDMQKLRGSYYFLGALLGKFHKVRSLMPGGCNFGSRPIDLHLKGFEALGARMDINYGIIEGDSKELKGSSIFLDTVSVGATINIMIAASKAKGKTVIDNAAREPHVVDVANFLNMMGANIKGAGTDIIRIEGKPFLPGNKEYAIIPDQIEAGTFMMMAPLTRGDITVEGIIPTHMETLTAKLLEMGVSVTEGEDFIRVSMDENKEFKTTSFKTMPYPGYPTDMQPQTVVLLTQAKGTGRMIENVWESRYEYIDQLSAMGANIMTSGKLAVVQGPVPLTASRVDTLNLRAGAAMVMAGLAAAGKTMVCKIETIERGYENFWEKLKSLGAKIERVEAN